MSLWSRISNAVHDRALEPRDRGRVAVAHRRSHCLRSRPQGSTRTFGSALRAREASSIRVAGWLESLLADVRFGWRQLRRNRVTSVAAVLSLALGVGSCVAAFRLIDALLWRPLPISGSSNLYVLSRQMTGFDGKPVEDGHWATPDFNLMRDAVKEQADLIAISDADRTDITWSTDGDVEKAHVAYVSGNMFPLFLALSPRLVACLPPPMTGAPVSIPMRSSPGTIGITASAAIPMSSAARSTSATRPSKSSASALVISLELKRERSRTSFSPSA